MNLRKRLSRIAFVCLMGLSAAASAQTSVPYNCSNGQCVPADDIYGGARTNYDWSRSSGSDWNRSSVRGLTPVSRKTVDEFPELPGTPSGRTLDWRLSREMNSRDLNSRDLETRDLNPRLPMNRDWNEDLLSDGFDAPAPRSNSRNRNDFQDFGGRNTNTGRQMNRRPEYGQQEFDRFPEPLSGRDSLSPLDGRDPFVPAPAPRNNSNSEAPSISEMITSRYQNPVNVRSVRSMTSSQAVNLFAEVSRKIDERHLEPTSYDVRVRRALRNLYIALETPAFVQSLGISADSFRVDGFRETLSRLSSSMQVSNYSSAQAVMTQVMQQAQSVPGLTPSVVAFEFANASLDTLDKFSGLEPSETMAGSGAGVEDSVKSAALEDEIVGVGVEVKQHEEGLLVVKPLRGGPAAEAGIESGDVIIAIDGRSISGMSMANSVDLMKGASGSRMTVRIFREGRGEKNFTLARRKVRVWTVNDVKLLAGTDVGYLTLSRFAQNSTAEMDEALMQLHKQGMKSLVLDLRGNPGGLLTTCVEISDRFLPCGTIVSTKGRLSDDNMVETATYNRTWAVPLVVLVDNDSASASEIFAAAVQENGRGVVVGTQSYGKGTVQTHFPLSAINGSLRLTTARFYSPSGRPMAGEGVSPDVEIHDADGVANGDEVLTEAVRIARSSRLAEMAKASGSCRNLSPSAGRSSSIDQINDPAHPSTAIR
ncbi:MAG: S41 family peptidase [Planctomyces sp.]|nr:S41 family peptidase [Planctomyces sp.]